MDVKVGLWRKLSAKELMLSNCGVGELFRVPRTARRSNQSILKEFQSWIFTGRTDAEAEAPIIWPPDVKNWVIGKDPDAVKDWRWEEKGNRGWDGWMASPSQWAWVWATSGNWWWTGKPGMLQSMRSHKVGYDWATELNWTGFSLQWLVLLQSMGSKHTGFSSCGAWA